LKYHCPRSTTLNTLIDVGFESHRVEESAPTREQIELLPELAEELEWSMMLLVSAQKTEARWASSGPCHTTRADWD
jgi:hypothetical protein